MTNTEKTKMLNRSVELLIVVSQSRQKFNLQSKTFHESPDGVKWFDDMNAMFDAVMIVRGLLKDGRL